MTHRTVVNIETGETFQVEYTPEEQAIHDAAVVAQQAEAETQAAIIALNAEQASTKTLADQILESPTELAKLKAGLGL